MMSAADPLSPQDAIIYLMVTASAADGNIDDRELRTIGRVVRSFALFGPDDEARLVETSQACGRIAAQDGGLGRIMQSAQAAIPPHLAETAYAAVIDVVAADGGLVGAELRILDMVRQTLHVSDEGASAIERAARARNLTLDDVE